MTRKQTRRIIRLTIAERLRGMVLDGDDDLSIEMTDAERDAALEIWGEEIRKITRRLEGKVTQ